MESLPTARLLGDAWGALDLRCVRASVPETLGRVLPDELDSYAHLLGQVPEELLVSHELWDAVLDDLLRVDVSDDPPSDIGLLGSRLGGGRQLAHFDE